MLGWDASDSGALTYVAYLETIIVWPSVIVGVGTKLDNEKLQLSQYAERHWSNTHATAGPRGPQ